MKRKPLSKTQRSRKKKTAVNPKKAKPKILRKRELARLEKRKKQRVSDERVQETLFNQLVEAGLEGAVKPEDIARELYPEEWQRMLKRVRLMAKQQAVAGNLVILRKGEIADPEDFKGLIKLRVTERYLQKVVASEDEE